MKGRGDNDTFVYLAAGDVVAGESIDGGLGADTLSVRGVIDFRPVGITSIEKIKFTNDFGVGSFAASQFGDGISNAVEVTGASAEHDVEVHMTAAGTFSAANWTFVDWGFNNDHVVLIGTAGADTITGSSQRDRIRGGESADRIIGRGGSDTLMGGGDNDTFVIAAAADHPATERIEGGDGLGDEIIFTAMSGTLVLNALMTSVETVEVSTVFIIGGTIGPTGLDASAVTYGLTLIGDHGRTTITGSSHNDVMTGGGGNDTIVYAPGGGADMITDFVAGAGTDDTIDLTAFANIRAFAGVLARTTQARANAVIDLGNGDTLTLQSVQKASLRADDFILTPNLKTSFVSAGSWTGAGNDAQGWYVGDFNRDGLDDIFRHSAGVSGAEVFLSNGSSFGNGSSWTGAGNDAQGWYVGDFNGDNRDDILRHNAGVSGAEVFLSNGSSFGNGASWTGAGNDAQGWYVGDFNGDGKDDIFRHNAGVSGAEVFLSNGSAFVFAGGWTGAGNDAQGWYVGDFNGDGRDDIFRNNDGVSGAEVFLSNGSSAFVFDGSWTGAGVGSDGQWHLGDFNGDGKTDIFRYLEGQSGADVFLSNGSAFVSAGSWTGAGKGTDGRWYIGDYDGDGTGDLLRYLAGFSGAEVLL